MSRHMRRRALRAHALRLACQLTVATVLLLAFVGPVQAASPPLSEPASTLLVQFTEPLPEELARERLRSAGLEPLRRIPRIDVWVARPSSRAAMAAAALDLAAQPGIAWAEESIVVHAVDVIPNDPRYGEQWPLPKINAPAAWRLTRGMSAPIAIIDSGIDLDHVDLQPKLWVNPGEIAGNGVDDDGNGYSDDVYGYNFIDRDAEPQDDHSHGSHVASIAAAAGNNAAGVAGLAWGTPLMALKVLDNYGLGDTGGLAEALVYAADNGARIINLSLSWDHNTPSQVAEEAVAYALSQGCLIVAATGNDGGAVGYPARLPGVLAVGATDSADVVASFSNRGPEVDLVAPGVSVLGCNHLGGWVYKSGTSMAAPHVAGTAALVWGRLPALPYDELASLLKSMAVDLLPAGYDEASGAGRLDAGAAVMAASPRYLAYAPIAFGGR
mgnify:FL=1